MADITFKEITDPSRDHLAHILRGKEIVTYHYINNPKGELVIINTCDLEIDADGGGFVPGIDETTEQFAFRQVGLIEEYNILLAKRIQLEEEQV